MLLPESSQVKNAIELTARVIAKLQIKDENTQDSHQVKFILALCKTKVGTGGKLQTT